MFLCKDLHISCVRTLDYEHNQNLEHIQADIQRKDLRDNLLDMNSVLFDRLCWLHTVKDYMDRRSHEVLKNCAEKHIQKTELLVRLFNTLVILVS